MANARSSIDRDSHPRIGTKRACLDLLKVDNLHRTRSGVWPAFLLVILFVGPWSPHSSAAQRANTVPDSRPPVNRSQPFIVGADISWVQAAEARGLRYRDQGVERNIPTILKDHGFNYIRLRVFNDPTQPTPRDRPLGGRRPHRRYRRT